MQVFVENQRRKLEQKLTYNIENMYSSINDVF